MDHTPFLLCVYKNNFPQTADVDRDAISIPRKTFLSLHSTDKKIYIRIFFELQLSTFLQVLLDI